MYAVIESGGKQHKVEKGMTLPVDLLKDEPGAKITFENVLLYVDDKNVEIGQPYLSNVKVTACLLYTSPSPRDLSTSRMPSSA